LLPRERLNAAAELSIGAYHMKGSSTNVPARLQRTLSIFNNRKIRYLLIGGYAVSLHAQPRATKDLDLLVSLDAGNAQALYAALAEFGSSLTGLAFGQPIVFKSRGEWLTGEMKRQPKSGSRTEVKIRSLVRGYGKSRQTRAAYCVISLL